jgi:hypothetical protein
MAAIAPVEVLRGKYKNPSSLFGPLPGVREGNVVVYEFEQPGRFAPWPGRTRLERTFVLLDVGVSFSNPCWARETRPDGTVFEVDPRGRDSWYVDLVTVEAQGDWYIFRDLYIDVIVPTDGRHYRLLDLDEYAEALRDGAVSLAVAVDGLRRWQRFLDRHLHAERWPPVAWSDFPPRAIRALAALPAPFAPPVRAPD